MHVSSLVTDFIKFRTTQDCITRATVLGLLHCSLRWLPPSPVGQRPPTSQNGHQWSLALFDNKDISRRAPAASRILSPVQRHLQLHLTPAASLTRIQMPYHQLVSVIIESTPRNASVRAHVLSRHSRPLRVDQGPWESSCTWRRVSTLPGISSNPVEDRRAACLARVLLRPRPSVATLSLSALAQIPTTPTNHLPHLFPFRLRFMHLLVHGLSLWGVGVHY